MALNEHSLQRNYYRDTATRYDQMHVSEHDEHHFALSFIVGMFDFLGIRSVLDVGSGTGRAISFIKQKRPDVYAIGIEPVEELRMVGYRKGLSIDELLDGDGANLPFGDNEFDMVCEFGVLHHVQQPGAVVSEMLRVANKAVFISDNNIYGDSSSTSRILKQILQKLSLWKAAIFFKTKGKGYMSTEIDGIAYYYSVFDSFNQIKAACSSVHFINTNIWTGADKDLYRTATHIGLLGRLSTNNNQR